MTSERSSTGFRIIHRVPERLFYDTTNIAVSYFTVIDYASVIFLASSSLSSSSSESSVFSRATSRMVLPVL